MRNREQEHFDAVKAKQDGKIRAAIIEDCAKHFDGLAVLRKMWSAAEVAAILRARAALPHP